MESVSSPMRHSEIRIGRRCERRLVSEEGRFDGSRRTSKIERRKEKRAPTVDEEIYSETHVPELGGKPEGDVDSYNGREYESDPEDRKLFSDEEEYENYRLERRRAFDSKGFTMEEESASNGSIFRNFEGEEMMGRVILFAIASLFTAILFLLLLHLYARLFLWRVEHHLNLNNTPGSTVIGPNHRRRRFVFAQGQENPPRNAGLDSTTLQSIPVLVFKSCDFKDGLECAVCLSHLVDEDRVRVLPGCKHGFHVDCIDMWFQSHSTCPLCRNMVGSVEETRQGGSEGSLSQDESSVLGFPTEPQNFPTNVLVWGDHNQVTSAGLVVTEDHQHESTTSTNGGQEVREVVVDIPVSSSENLSERTEEEEEESKSPMFTRLRSLKKLLSSREKKGVVCISGSSGSINNNV